MLLHYFGEKYDTPNCGACDNCLHPKTQFEGKEDILGKEMIMAKMKNFGMP
jgi:ATP-dependent DNA helicase RecQ